MITAFCPDLGLRVFDRGADIFGCFGVRMLYTRQIMETLGDLQLLRMAWKLMNMIRKHVCSLSSELLSKSCRTGKNGVVHVWLLVEFMRVE